MKCITSNDMARKRRRRGSRKEKCVRLIQIERESNMIDKVKKSENKGETDNINRFSFLEYALSTISIVKIYTEIIQCCLN